MTQRNFLNDLLGRMAQAGRRRRANEEGAEPNVIALFDRLLGDRGEASGLVTAMQALDQFEASSTAEKHRIFGEIARKYDADPKEIETAIKDWQAGDVEAARRLHFSAEPKSQELIRRLNRVPGATARLVKMRADLLRATKEIEGLSGLDQDFQHLFSSWFNRGFLEIRRIDWNTSANILEKIIAYEAVHEITGWDDLHQRVASSDRRLFAFFHPAMPSDPLIFVEVALLANIPGAIGPIITNDRDMIDPAEAKVAVFYSISNCHKGLQGISFGNFLIKQVVAELEMELPALETLVTLSPVPGLRKWAEANPDGLLSENDLEAIASHEGPTREHTARLAALYLTQARRRQGTAHDPVAHFHFSNGAELHKVNAGADASENGIENAWGVMVNYLYDASRIEAHHQAYTADRKIAVSAEVTAQATEQGKRRNV